MKRYLVVIFTFFIMLPLELVAQGDISAARAAFFSKNMAGADQLLQNELLINPTNQEAHFFRAITRIFRVMESNPDDSHTGIYTDSMIGMLDQFGFSPAGRDLFNFSSKSPNTLPVDSPSGGDVQTFFENVVLPEISQAITNNLHEIDASFLVIITPAELAGFEINITEPLEIDYGDVKLLEAALSTLQACLLSYLAYDMDVDIDELAALDGMIDLQSDILPDYPTLFTVRSGKEALLKQTQMSVQNAIAAYLTGADFIKAETDEQSNDLVTIYPEDFGKEEKFRTRLINIQDALYSPAYLTVSDHERAFVNLTRFFDATFDIRNQLPPVFIDTETSSVYDGDFPDPTFHGIIPSAQFDFETNELHIPVVKSELGAFEVTMHMSNQALWEFSLLAAVPVFNSINPPADFTFNTGILDIPIVDVILGTNVSRYSVEMLLNPNQAPASTVLTIIDVTEK